MKVIDLHCDSVLALLEDEQNGKESSFLKNEHHLDIEKMQKGDWMLQNMALFTDRKLLDIPEQQAMRLYERYCRLLEEVKDYAAPVYTFSDIEKNTRENKISLMLTLEDGGVVFHDLSMLHTWYHLGVRMIALVWNYPNGIGHPNFVFEAGADYKQPDLLHCLDTQNGLTDFGIAYVQEMEKLGIIIDVSHLSDAGFWDVLKHTTKPFVASHSNARGVCNVARNLSDEMILALANRGGLMGINYCAGFLSEDGKDESRIEDMVRHILYIKNLAGVDCIALGSDFDGIGCQMELKDASFLPKLESALFQNGLSKEEIEKIFWKNALNLYARVLQ